MTNLLILSITFLDPIIQLFNHGTGHWLIENESTLGGLNLIGWEQTGTSETYSKKCEPTDTANFKVNGYFLVGAEIGGVPIGTKHNATFEGSLTLQSSVSRCFFKINTIKGVYLKISRHLFIINWLSNLPVLSIRVECSVWFGFIYFLDNINDGVEGSLLNLEVSVCRVGSNGFGVLRFSLI